jgi:hypothetical protein
MKPCDIVKYFERKNNWYIIRQKASITFFTLNMCIIQNGFNQFSCLVSNVHQESLDQIGSSYDLNTIALWWNLSFILFNLHLASFYCAIMFIVYYNLLYFCLCFELKVFSYATCSYFVRLFIMLNSFQNLVFKTKYFWNCLKLHEFASWACH